LRPSMELSCPYSECLVQRLGNMPSGFAAKGVYWRKGQQRGPFIQNADAKKGQSW
jgi:hypothetical protein